MRAGDEEFDEIYRAHRDGLFRLGVLICGDAGRSEDAVADAFARVLAWRRRRAAGGLPAAGARQRPHGRPQAPGT